MVQETVTWADATTAIASGLTVGVVIIAAFYTRHQLQEVRRTRHADAMFRLTERWGDLADARRDLYDYSGRPDALLADLTEAIGANSKRYFELVRIPNFFEDLAIQVAARNIPRDMVRESFGPSIRAYWRIWAPAAPLMRATDEEAHVNFEKLAGDMERARNDD